MSLARLAILIVVTLTIPSRAAWGHSHDAVDGSRLETHLRQYHATVAETLPARGWHLHWSWPASDIAGDSSPSDRVAEVASGDQAGICAGCLILRLDVSFLPRQSLSAVHAQATRSQHAYRYHCALLL